MKISIITPTYNSGATIGDTLNSLLQQTGVELEYIVIDGASSDNTLDIIRAYSAKIGITLLSEPDQGLYEAMNKGIKLATGDIIGILNSDDFYKDESILKKVVHCFEENPDCQACYGDLEFVERDNPKKIVRFWRAGKYAAQKLNSGWTIPHPTLFVRREVYQQYGAFRPDFKIAGDYELILRLLKKEKISTFYLPEILVCMRSGGRSGRNLKQRRAGWRELKLAWRINNFKLPPLFIIRRLLSKIRQYF
ncbi:MAG: glycosyltransferase family 2 protein [Patescibacteria group bacterium]